MTPRHPPPPIAGLSRRRLLVGLVAATALPRFAVAARNPSEAILAQAGLADLSGFSAIDLTTGAALGAHRADAGAPPASVLKVMTALYALDALGPEYRFETRLVATGPVADGALRGDLALVGDGDPLLDTNALRALARALRAAGVTRIEGRLRMAAGALPAIAMTNPDQPPHAGYNPAVSGLNLDFNRVRLDWTPRANGAALRFHAPGRDFSVDVAGVAGVVGAADPPAHRLEANREVWELSARRMNRPGGVWLPVRRPAAYAGEVFRAVALLEGVTLPAPEIADAPPAGETLAVHDSPPLNAILRGMLRHSTNLTAEAVGLRASQALAGSPETLAASAASMTAWAGAAYGVSGARFVDHSGLSDASRWSPAETVAVLAAERARLSPLLKEIGVSGPDDPPGAYAGLRVAAKSGTLYFASGLAGYVEGRDGALAFAIYSADPERRRGLRPDAAAAPAGAKAWGGRARAMQAALIREWIAEAMPAPPLRPRPRG